MSKKPKEIPQGKSKGLADDLPEEVLRMINQEDGFTSSMADLIEPVDPLVAVASSELPS